MKWMGWSWDDYLAAPYDVVIEIIAMINAEQEELAKIRSQGPGG